MSEPFGFGCPRHDRAAERANDNPDDIGAMLMAYMMARGTACIHEGAKEWLAYLAKRHNDELNEVVRRMTD